MLRGELAPVGLGEDLALGDADQRVMSVVVLAPGEVGLVGRDERNALRIGKLDQRRLGRALGRSAMALQFDIEPVAEQPLQRRAATARKLGLAGRDRRIERPARPAGQRDQAVGLAFEPGQLQMRLLGRRRFEEGPRAQPHQAAIARLARGEQHDPRQRARSSGKPRIARLVAEIDRERAADDRLDAGRGHLVGEFQRAEHVVGVGQRQRRLLVGLGELGELADRQRAFQQRIGGMHVQMHEAGIGRRVGRQGVLGDSVCAMVRTTRQACPPRSRSRGEPCRLSPAAGVGA